MNNRDFAESQVKVDVSQRMGRLELYRHSFGQGGINPLPLPKSAIEGIKKLKPRSLRIFIQEYFRIYREDGTFNWELLDPYLDALVETGAKIVACITIKPRRLFPEIDQRIWRPKDIKEWQNVIYELVGRYSLEKQAVTYWEIANEPDIGEDGGTPYLIPDPKEYFEFYKMTIEPIIEACPTVKVGGPALASVNSPILRGWIELCKETGTRLDFVSWHLYSDDPALHALGIEKVKDLLKDFPSKRPEMLITEWNRNIADVSGEFKDASIVSACIISMLEAGVDWTFYYQIWDQVFYEEQFKDWFSPKGIQNMRNFWNPVPRFGLFDLEGRVRTPYFVYWMLSKMGEERLFALSDDEEVKVLASASDEKMTLFMTNLSSKRRRINLNIVGLKPGEKELKVYTIDERGLRFSPDLNLSPVEEKRVFAPSIFSYDLFAPPYSVFLLTIGGAG